MNSLKFDKRRLRVKKCPCGRSNKDGKFSPFEGHYDKGHCHSCGQTFMPERVTNCGLRVANPASREKKTRKPKPATRNHAHDLFPYFKASHRHEQENNLVQFFISVFGTVITAALVSCYLIGTSKRWKGATVFWQITKDGAIYSGKVMLFDALTGKRVRDKRYTPTWAHTLLELQDFQLKHCFFGEHLLNEKENRGKPVAIVESEKTAMIASVYLPRFVWLASGSKSGLSEEKCAALAGRQVTLFPDADAFAEWDKKAQEFGFGISMFSETYATTAEKEMGCDLADYLLQFSYTEFDAYKKGLGYFETTPAAIPEAPFETLEFSDVLDVQQALHEIEARKVVVPAEVWTCFWNIYDNRSDAASYRKLVAFISLN